MGIVCCRPRRSWNAAGLPALLSGGEPAGVGSDPRAFPARPVRPPSSVLFRQRLMTAVAAPTRLPTVAPRRMPPAHLGPGVRAHGGSGKVPIGRCASDSAGIDTGPGSTCSMNRHASSIDTRMATVTGCASIADGVFRLPGPVIHTQTRWRRQWKMIGKMCNGIRWINDYRETEERLHGGASDTTHRRQYSCTGMHAALSNPGARATANRCPAHSVNAAAGAAAQESSGIGHLPRPAQRLGPGARPDPKHRLGDDLVRSQTQDELPPVQHPARTLARVLHPAGLLGTAPGIDRLHAQSTQRLPEVGHADFAVRLQHEQVHDTGVGIQLELQARGSLRAGQGSSRTGRARSLLSTSVALRDSKSVFAPVARGSSFTLIGASFVVRLRARTRSVGGDDGASCADAPRAGRAWRWR